MKAVFAVLLLAILAVPAEAAPNRFVKWVKTHKWPIVETAVMIAAATADAKTTLDAEARCPSCRERGAFLGSRPTAGRLALVEGIEVAAYSSINWWSDHVARRDGARWLHLVDIANTAVWSGYHARAAYGNAQIKNELSGAIPAK
jgi:hypothetical protein